MAKNIFEELIEEMERILNSSFNITAKAIGCEFCFRNFKKNQIIEAFQNTVVFAMKNTCQKKFIFQNKEIHNLNSLASLFLKLVSAGINPQRINNDTNNQFHFSGCISCQMTLIETAEYFTRQLILEKRKSGPTLKELISRFLQKIFGFKAKKRFCERMGVAVLPVPYSYFPLIFGLETFVNSREKWEILRKYLPLFKEKGIEPEKIIDTLDKVTEEKKNNLKLEEFEKALKDLLMINKGGG